MVPPDRLETRRRSADSVGVEPVSPELALVDEVLDDSARRALPDVPDCLTPAERPLAATADRHEHARTPVRSVAALLLVCTVGWALPGSSPSEPRGAPAQPFVPADTAHEAGFVAGRPVELRWRPVPGAVFYNVILWRGDSRVRDFWPDRTSVRIQPGSLAPGVYRWFVYPSVGTGTESRFGRLAAHGLLKL